MERKLYAIFVAGGQGTRMGAGTPKQFLPLGGIPVLMRTISRFQEAFDDITPVVVLPSDHIETWKQLCVEYDFNCKQIVATGGITRFHSVKNALAKVPDGAIVMIHDGVRPLVSTTLLRRIAAASQDACAVIPVTPVTDTLKILERDADGHLHTADEKDPDRSRLFGAQTPQAFHSEVIREAYSQLGFDTAFTDDASVARKKNIPLSYVEGERYNIKITTPEDLRLAEMLLG